MNNIPHLKNKFVSVLNSKFSLILTHFPSLYSVLFVNNCKLFVKGAYISMMNMQKNIGILNALLRITCGLSMLTWLTAKMVRKPWKSSYMFWVVIAAMKVAEGIVRFCPVTALFSRGQNLYDELVDEMADMMNSRNTDYSNEPSSIPTTEEQNNI